MRSLFLSTSSNETDKYCDSLRNLNLGETQIIRYDGLGMTDQALYAQARDWKPDLLVYIGARWGKQPSISALANLNNKVAPMVHICSDAGDPPWHDLLREYNSHGAFALQVSIDGSHKWPFADTQMTALTPVDPALFPPVLVPHRERTIILGYGGNPGGGPQSKRTIMLSQLLAHPDALDIRMRSTLPHTYEAYCFYLAKLRMSLNVSFTGTEASMHVKGRVLESALAGACLLETRGSPSNYWFKPGLDYLEYSTAEEAMAIRERLKNEPEESQAIADSLRRRVLAEHSPAVFWQRIFGRIGIDTAAVARVA